jgi:hypothetical protein
LSTQSARQPAYAGGLVAPAVELAVAVADGSGIGVLQGFPDGVAARIAGGAVLTAAAARLLVVGAPEADAIVEVVACALTAAGNGVETYGVDVTLAVLDAPWLDAVLGGALRVLLPAPTGVEPPEGNADAETWTNSSAAPTAAMDAARTPVLRRDAVMSGTPSGRVLGT